MMIKRLLLLAISTTSLCVCTYVYFDEKISFDAAVLKCKTLGMQLAMAKTKDTYLTLLNFIDTISVDQEGLWFGLEYNSTISRYQWLNGELLVRGDWNNNQAGNGDCVVFRNENAKWLTGGCGVARQYLCEKVGHDPRFIVFLSTIKGTFEEVKQTCLDRGYRIPIVPTADDKLALKHFILYHPVTRDVFLGIEKTPAGNYQWLDGVDVEYYAWKDIANCPLNINIQHDGFHCGNDVPRPYICEHNVSMSSQQPLATLISTTVNIPAVPLQEHDVMITTQCAMLCNANIQCYYFTFKLQQCHLYGNLDYIVTGSGDHSLWSSMI
ncbi:macrophage mannose receptor 1-like [Patella vulgata]|uniref:macrophage mannose receptor 1-like n=1 Tax=Patella vulgata TaxID=6465 RepID=UPI0024A7B8C8|nr:macrophage mannose receptor 1-like [Patella vulgata]